MAIFLLFGAAGCRSFDFYAKTLMAPVPGEYGAAAGDVDDFPA